MSLKENPEKSRKSRCDAYQSMLISSGDLERFHFLPLDIPNRQLWHGQRTHREGVHCDHSDRSGWVRNTSQPQ